MPNEDAPLASAATQEPTAPLVEQTVCIVGLGNPGTRYAATPHNLGFRVVDELAKRHGLHIAKTEGASLTGSGRILDKKVILVKPQTFMNNSGMGVNSVLKSHNLTHRNLIVVYDELALPWTGLRIKLNGSAAGHNGVKSIDCRFEDGSLYAGSAGYTSGPRNRSGGIRSRAFRARNER